MLQKKQKIDSNKKKKKCFSLPKKVSRIKMFVLCFDDLENLELLQDVLLLLNTTQSILFYRLIKKLLDSKIYYKEPPFLKAESLVKKNYLSMLGNISRCHLWLKTLLKRKKVKSGFWFLRQVY